MRATCTGPVRFVWVLLCALSLSACGRKGDPVHTGGDPLRASRDAPFFRNASRADLRHTVGQPGAGDGWPPGKNKNHSHPRPSFTAVLGITEKTWSF